MKKCSTEYLALIPARGGSKGLPGKNIKPLAGKPLITYTIQAALESRYLHACYVSSDDPGIMEVSRTAGVGIIERPGTLAEDLSPIEDAIRHALLELQNRGQSSRYFLLLPPTAPLRTAAHIDACIEQFEASSAGSVYSVTEEDHHPYKSLVMENGFLRPLFDRESLSAARQSLPTIYRQNGAIYLTSMEAFLRHNTLFIEPVLPYIMMPGDSIDIDREIDFQLAELLYEQSKMNYNNEK
jgi:CMP-N-acetylneuraminic acid synthetase